MGGTRPLVACFAAAALTACGLSVAGLQQGDGGAASTDAQSEGHSSFGDSCGCSLDAHASDAFVQDAPATDAAPTDAPSGLDVIPVEASPTDGCKATGPEQCTNGVDDDCNGLADCADPACTTAGYACVGTFPGGWQYVPFDAASQAGCPAGLTQSKVDVDPQNLSTSATCSCACAAGGAVSCEVGGIATKFGPDGTCGAPTVPPFPANGGNCNTQNLMVEPYVEATPPPATGGTCAANPTTTVPPTDATQGEYCPGQKAYGGGCSTGQVCALAPAGYQQCIHHGGVMACPAGSYVTAHAVGTLQDSRACSPCTCTGTPTATCAGSWSFFDGTGCSGNGLAIAVDGNCDATSSDPTHTYGSNKYSATPSNLACSPPAAQPSPTGGAALNGQDTVCCE